MRTAIITGAAVALLALPACGGDDTPSTPPPPDRATTERQVITGYADLASRQYTAAARGVTALKTSVTAFLARPTADTMAAARQAWIASRPAYLNTEVFRFYGGPIDNPDTGREPFINAWPLDEAFLDYVEGDAGAGIINKPADFPKLDAETIAAQN